MREEAKKLEDKLDGLHMRIDEEENNARVVLPEVKVWLRDARDSGARTSEIETEIRGRRIRCFDLRSRYLLSRKAKKATEDVKKLHESGAFNVISVPPPPEAFAPIRLGSTLEFRSRNHMEEEIMGSLRGNEANRVGICGMGGVGKTTMARRLMHRARQENLFHEIIMTIVSQKVDKFKIQDDIALSLGLRLTEGSLASRAHILRTRLTAGKTRTLVVVDDVWDNLQLEELGIPFDSGCKVLVTSRNRDIFNSLIVQKVYSLGILLPDEAWELFKLKVGDCVNRLDVLIVAQEVVEECKGLPIALVTVGAALRNVESIRVWRDWLDQLMIINPGDPPVVLDGVYKPLRLSYEFLKIEQAKSLFLLCCLYPEDYDIPLEELTIYTKGTGMFRGITLQRARNRVGSLVEFLKSRFLLLDGSSANHVKMHDVIRNLAIYITSEKKLITCDSRSNDCKWISPQTSECIRLDGGSRVFPNLHLLWIKNDELKMDDEDFFKGMKELNVFSIKRSLLQQLPRTMRSLENLQTLILDSCRSLKSLSGIGELLISKSSFAATAG